MPRPPREISSEKGEREREREKVSRTNLHHENNGVEGNHDHDEPLERSGHDELPDSILDRVLVLRHVATRRPRIDGEVDTLFLYAPEITRPSQSDKLLM